MQFLSKLKISKFKFIIQTTQPLWLPEYKGSTFRGAFGVTFKRIVCVDAKQLCEQCLLKDNCPYYAVFESPNPGTLPELDSPKIPHPFLLEPPLEQQEQFPTGSQLTFYLILVGQAIAYLPYFIYTFDSMGRKGGIGKGRREGQGRFHLQAVYDGFDEQIQAYDGTTQMLRADFNTLTAAEITTQLPNYPITQLPNHPVTQSPNHPITQLSLQFQTPTRIKHQGRYLLLKDNGNLDFQLLIENLYRRIYCLAYFHGEPFDEGFILPQTEAVELKESQLQWQDWERYSHRQRTRMKLGGFVGTVVYQGELKPWLPLVKAGEILHVGKATAFGLGKYVLAI